MMALAQAMALAMAQAQAMAMAMAQAMAMAMAQAQAQAQAQAMADLNKRDEMSLVANAPTMQYIRKLEAKNVELEKRIDILINHDIAGYKEGLSEFEKKLEAVEMVHSNYVNVSCDLYSTLEKKLEIAVEALTKSRHFFECERDTSGTKVCDDALSKIKSEGL